MRVRASLNTPHKLVPHERAVKVLDREQTRVTAVAAAASTNTSTITCNRRRQRIMADTTAQPCHTKRSCAHAKLQTVANATLQTTTSATLLQTATTEADKGSDEQKGGGVRG